MVNRAHRVEQLPYAREFGVRLKVVLDLPEPRRHNDWIGGSIARVLAREVRVGLLSPFSSALRAFPVMDLLRILAQLSLGEGWQTRRNGTYPISGSIPSWVSMPIRPEIPHSSAIFPSSIRSGTMESHSAYRPVGSGTRGYGPVFVSAILTFATTQSSSPTSRSMAADMSGKAARSMRMPSATPPGPSGWAKMILLWSTKSSATSSSTSSTLLLLKTSPKSFLATALFSSVDMASLTFPSCALTPS